MDRRSTCFLGLCFISLAACAGDEAQTYNEILVGDDTQASGWGDEDGDDPGASEGCVVDGELRGPLVMRNTETDTIVLVEADGQMKELPVSGLGRPCGASVRGDWVAVNTCNAQVGTSLSLFARAGGAPVWSRDFPDGNVRSVEVNSSGEVVFALHGEQSCFDGEQGWWISASGTEEEVVTSFLPRGERAASGWIPGFFADPSDCSSDFRLTGWGWIDPSTQTKLLLSEEIFSPPDLEIEDGFFEYLRAGVPAAERARLFRGGPEGNTWIEFEFESSVRLRARNGTWRLFSVADEDAPQLVRISTSTGVVEPFDRPEPPEGYTYFGCDPGEDVSIDRAGRVAFFVRDAAAARVALWDPSLETWSFVGLPMAEILDATFQSEATEPHLSVYAVATDVLCEPDGDWLEPPPETLLGDSIQLIHGDSGEGYGVGGSLLVSQTGRCVAWRGASAWFVRDFVSGDELTLSEALEPLAWVDATEIIL